MSHFGEVWIRRNATYFSHPDASADALLNDATQWLHFAHSGIQLLGELMRERCIVDARRLPVMLESVAAFVEMGMRCVAQAHGRMQWERVQGEAGESVAP